MTRQPPRKAPDARAVLAQRVRLAYRTAPVYSTARRAAGVALVALETTTTPRAARQALQRHRLPDDLRTAALALLEPTEGDTTP